MASELNENYVLGGQTPAVRFGRAVAVTALGLGAAACCAKLGHSSIESFQDGGAVNIVVGLVKASVACQLGALARDSAPALSIALK